MLSELCSCYLELLLLGWAWRMGVSTTIAGIGPAATASSWLCLHLAAVLQGCPMHSLLMQGCIKCQHTSMERGIPRTSKGTLYLAKGTDCKFASHLWSAYPLQLFISCYTGKRKLLWTLVIQSYPISPGRPCLTHPTFQKCCIPHQQHSAALCF